MKKLRLRFVLLGLVLAAVWSGSGTKAAGDSPTLRFWTHQQPAEAQYVQTVLIPEFKRTHPHINIEYAVFPEKDYRAKLLAACAAGTGPDCFDLNENDYPAFIAKNLLDPVVPAAFGYKNLDRLAKIYLKNSLAGLTFDRKLYGIPIEQNPLCLLINAQIFREAGLDPASDYPKTWEDLAKVARKLVRLDGNGRMIREGFDLPYNGPDWAMYLFDALIRQQGGTILSPDGKKVLVNSKFGVAALQLWQDLLYRYKVGDPNISLASAAAPNADYFQGKVGMWVSGPGALELLQAYPEVARNTIIVPYPQVNPKKPQLTQYGWAWSVNSAASPAFKQAAWEWVALAAGQPTEWLTKVGFLQPRTGWYKTREAQSFPYLDVWMAALAQAQYLPRSSQYDAIGRAIERAVQRCIFNRMDPQLSLDAAAAEIEKALAEQ